MATIDIRKIDETLVIHFAADGKRINAYTLASTLVAFADAAKAANAALNSGCEIEVVVEAVGSGSFRARIRAIYKKNKSLLKDQIVAGLVLGVLGNYIYERTLAVDDTVKVEVRTDEVIIQRGDDRVIVPRNVYDATRLAEKNPEFPKAIARALEAVAQDPDIDGFGVVERLDSPAPELVLTRNELQRAALLPSDNAASRVVPEIVDLQILKAILERSKRKWEFMWRGVKISAPITDERFYIDFFAHDITIAPGDILRVTLHVHQKRDSATGIYKNVKYEVAHVHEHAPRVKQLRMPVEPA